ncbi:hypothetical protein [Alkalihalobacillus sp. 1P02AB]|uniref:hypothetical protein n=1 Tax=Alkalihalobacillus sp. 1P02AB TaxID=3132260 RepID=UPI0039A47D0A
MDNQRKTEYTLRVAANSKAHYEWLDLGVRNVETKKIIGLPSKKRKQKRYLVPPIQKRTSKPPDDDHNNLLHLVLLKDGTYCLEPGRKVQIDLTTLQNQPKIQAAVSVVISLSSLERDEQKRIHSITTQMKQLDLHLFDLIQYTMSKYGHIETTTEEGRKIKKWQKEKQTLELTRYETLTQIAIQKKIMPPHYRIQINIR